MGKIRVIDLAQKMGLDSQDLVFKLKSIGVRIEGENAEIDTDIIAAILTGKPLQQPREVILRDGETAAPIVRRTPPRRMRQPPGRPHRRRAMIQRVEQRIRTMPTKPKEVPADPVTPETSQSTEAEAAAAAETPALSAPDASTAAVGAQAKAARSTTVTRATTQPGPPSSRPPDFGRRPEGRRPGRPRPASQRDTTQDLRGYRGSVKEIERERELLETELSGRSRRRAQRRTHDDTGTAEEVTSAGDRPDDSVTISEGMTVRVFAERLRIKAKDLIKRLMKHGAMATVNQVLDTEVAIAIAQEMGFEAEVISFEEEIQNQEEVALEAPGENLEPRAPVITIMGHVDHGKTSLLDRIRSSKLTEAEAGGITQHIAAYSVDVNDRKIVFLDTPGHEAFTKLRARGAQITDIVVLVVAADDGVMAQTLEAIDHAKSADVPIVVAINKIDKANANPDKVKQELSDRGLIVEEWGGDVIAVQVSAQTGAGIDDLLENLLLTADLLELQADPTLSGQGVIVEARKEKGRGNVATVLVQTGTLRRGDICVAGGAWGKVRAMTNDVGERIEEAGPATPVEIIGFGDLPAAGDMLQVVGHESKARSIAALRQEETRRRELAPTLGSVSLEQLFARLEKEGESEELPVVLKCDVHGSVEVLKDTLEDLSTDKVRIKIVLSGVGGISTNDISLAAASKAIVLGFNVRPERAATELAHKEGIDVRLHTVIYDIIDELQKAMTGLLKPIFEDVDLGRAEVRETFKVPRIGTIAGCHVVEGTITRSAMARLLRDNVVVYQGKISSLRRFKDDAAEVRSGFDCGIGLDRFQDLKPGDFIEVYERQEITATL